MSLADVERLLDARRADHLEQLFTLVRQESVSAQDLGVAACADLVRAMLVDAGFETRVIRTAGQPVVYGEHVHDRDALTLLFYGHYDVQPPDPLDAWHSPPFEPTLRDGRVFGRGAGDNKGQFLAHVLAVQAYLDAEGALPINVKIVLEGEEEVGSPHLAAFVAAHRALLAADLVYTSDGPMHESGSPVVLLGVRGVLQFELHARGAAWDNHSGNKGNIVPNPAWTLVDALRTMRDADGKVLVEGFYDDIRSPSTSEQRLLAALPFDREDVARAVGYDRLALDGAEYYRLLTMEPTFNICGFHSGYGGAGTKTIIPATATVKMDARLVVDQSPEDVFAKIETHLAAFAPGVEATFVGAMKPSRTPVDHPLLAVVEDAVRSAYGREPLLMPSLGGSVPNYVWTDILGAPAILVPYANADEANHAPNENIRLDAFYDGIRCTCHVLHALGRRMPSPQRPTI